MKKVMVVLFTACFFCGVYSSVADSINGIYNTITLDGSMSDWNSASLMYPDAQIVDGAPAASTYSNVYVCNDDSYLYVALQLKAVGTINDSYTYNLFIDADMDSGTGFDSGWMTGGYDSLVQYGGGGTVYSIYNFNGASQSTWDWTFQGTINYSYSDTITEWGIPKNLIGLTGDDARLEFQTTGSGVTTETWANQSEANVGTYTFASVPEPSSALVFLLGTGLLCLFKRARK